MFFAITIKTYFQKITNPADIASRTGVRFTISHITAVLIPAAFGFLWLITPPPVFLLGATMAGVSFYLARLTRDALLPENASLIGGVRMVVGAAE